MALIGQITVGMRVNTGGFSKGMDRASGSMRGFAAAAGRAQAAAGGLSIGKALVGFGAFRLAERALMGIGGAIGGAVKGASDLNEAVSKVDAVFGQAGGAIVKQADVMATKFGTVKTEFIDGATGIAQMGLSAKLSTGDAVKLGNAMAELGANLSSQDNISFADSMEKIRSGLAGEAEPLRKYGVLLSENAVKTRAMAMGAKLVGGQLAENDKVTARAAIITESLARVNGDLARTLDQPANAARKFTGTLSNLASSMGAMLLPAISTALKLLNEFGTFAVKAFEEHKGAVTGWIDSISWGLEVVGALFRNWPAVLEAAWLKIQEVFTNFELVVETLPENFGLVLKWIGENWYKGMYDAFNSTQILLINFTKNVVKLGKSIWDALGGKGFHFDPKTLTPMLEGLKITMEKLPDFVKPELISLQEGIDEQLNKIIDDLMNRLKQAPNQIPEVPIPGAGAGAGAAAAAKAQEYRGTAAVLAGSREAASATARARNQMASTDTAKATLEVNKRQLTALEKIAMATNEFNRKVAAASGVEAFQFT